MLSMLFPGFYLTHVFQTFPEWLTIISIYHMRQIKNSNFTIAELLVVLIHNSDGVLVHC